jgi:hypothetical protein
MDDVSSAGFGNEILRGGTAVFAVAIMWERL